MKLSAVVLFLAIAGIDLVTAKPIDSCTTQDKCLTFHTTLWSPATCEGSSTCTYQICAKLTLQKKGCGKDSTDSVSHTCVKPEDQSCGPLVGFPKPPVLEVGDIKDGNTQCQVVNGGNYAQFLFKDGSGCSDKLGSPGATQYCVPRPKETTSCTGNDVEKECIWYIKAPPCPNPGVIGDPHFVTRDGTPYSYHGECDLVMAHSSTFASGLGLDVHARTEIVTDWSLVSNAAVRIGSDIFELSNDGVHYFNGLSNAKMPVMMGGQFLLTQEQSPVQFKVDGDKLANLYTIHLDHNESISITQNMKMISVKLNTNLEETAGMLGSSAKAGMVGRDGDTVFDNPNHMGQEWQVNDKEPMLFHDIRAPQFPEKCQLPSVTSRRLRQSDELKSMAEKACAKVLGPMNLFCVDDVLATGNVNYANGYTAEVF